MSVPFGPLRSQCQARQWAVAISMGFLPNLSGLPHRPRRLAMTKSRKTMTAITLTEPPPACRRRHLLLPMPGLSTTAYRSGLIPLTRMIRYGVLLDVQGLAGILLAALVVIPAR